MRIGGKISVRPWLPGPPTGLVQNPATQEAARLEMRSVVDLPFCYNSAKGYLASANDKPARAGIPVRFSFSSDVRVERMGWIIEAGAPFSLDRVKAQQRNDFMSSSLQLRDVLLAHLEAKDMSNAAEGATAEAIRRVRNWDGHCRPDTAGGVSFEWFRSDLTRRLRTRIPGPAKGAAIAREGRIVARALADIGAIDESALRAAPEEGLQVAVDRLGNFRCGSQIHRLPSRHRLAPLIGSRCRFAKHSAGGGSGSEPLAKTVNATGGRQSIWFGAGARSVSDTGDMDAIHFVLPGGQAGWPNRAMPLDHWPLESDGRQAQLPLSLDGIRTRSSHRQTSTSSGLRSMRTRGCSRLLNRLDAGSGGGRPRPEGGLLPVDEFDA